MSNIVYCQEWNEKETGNPDGYSLHLKSTDCRDYIEDRDYEGVGSEPKGHPYRVRVKPKIMEQIRQSKNGIRRYDSRMPSAI